ncbi:S-adenosyl-L-methionine-dependent methyltransferase [Blyttiomyces helicus]|uniref:site-specific DNA-methyltransferase (adenine-specific) n=1 Tax=Blyttiomyces helicus TaxID=388810 RepID=A0A4V1ISK6_9FUNG|nr:S-adenosyl-L-methionine-dependent methyltransferase [Blyttiomyces helicus]|eukprot:RKO93887.1 S-adenosyl-L-methionine-dependent methyltransferase [Blyttiomyces helicus]
MSETLKPFVKWAGGKRRIMCELEKRFPRKFKDYYKPFIGGSSVMIHLQNKGVISDVLKKLKLTRSKQSKKIELAALFIFLNKTSYNGIYTEDRLGFYRAPKGFQSGQPKIFHESNLRSLSHMWKKTFVDFSSQPFEEVTKNAKKGDFVYLDPPYDGENMFTKYTAKPFKQAEQEALTNCFVSLHKRGCFVMMSNASTKRVKYLFKDFLIEEIYVKRSVSCKGEDRDNLCKEVIIRNYSSPSRD